MNTDESRWMGRAVGAWLLAAGCLLLASCNVLPEQQVDPVRHFTLSVPSGVEPVANPATVRPVQLAGHLRNRSLAIRVSENEVIYVDDARWAEPLDEALTQVLRNRLRSVPGGAAVTVQVQRFEPVRTDGNAVHLVALYTIIPLGGAIRTGSFTAQPRPWDGHDYAALVGALRASADELAETIAAASATK